MADPLTLSEHSALRTFLDDDDHPLYMALKKFCAYRRELNERECASVMRSVPRQFERASDYAAHAEAYQEFFGELRIFSEKS